MLRVIRGYYNIFQFKKNGNLDTLLYFLWTVDSKKYKILKVISFKSQTYWHFRSNRNLPFCLNKCQLEIMSSKFFKCYSNCYINKRDIIMVLPSLSPSIFILTLKMVLKYIWSPCITQLRTICDRRSPLDVPFKIKECSRKEKAKT